MISKACLALAVPLSFALACASSSPPASSPGAASCDELVTSARNDVSRAITDHRACTQDSDCTTVGLGASCFDSCTRAVAASGKPEVDAAVARANDAQCKQFAEQHCTPAPIPPCAPPPPPRCVSGQCG